MQLASSREMEGEGGGGRGGGEVSGMDAILSELHGHGQHSKSQSESQKGHFDESQSSQHDDFLEQMFSTIPNCSWPPHDHLSTSDPNCNPNSKTTNSDSPTDNPDASGSGPTASGFHYPFESLASSKLRLDHQQINQMNGAGAAKSLLQQPLILSHEALRSPCSDSGLLQLPLSLGGADSIDSHLRSRTHDVVDPSPFKSLDPQGEGDASVQAMYNKFVGTFLGNGQNPNQPQQQHFHHHPPQGGTMPGQNYGSQAAVMNQAQALAPPASASTGGSSGTGTGAGTPQRQRVRARRGQATDPHSIAERLRRERIAERMKALQELVPNANKTDKASMLDEIIDYVKFLQLQVKVLSMSRLGGASAVPPLVANMSTEGGGGVGRNTSTTINGNQTTASTNESNSMTMTEHQVAKLMEEDMGSAMQYLQGKGLCLMPISLATAISTATCRNPPLPPTRPQIINQANNTNTNSNSNTTIITNSLHQLTGTGPSPSNTNVDVGEASPSSVQSATLANGSSTDHSNPLSI